LQQYKPLSDVACREQIEEAVRARFAAEEADLQRVIGETRSLHGHMAEDCGLRVHRVSVTEYSTQYFTEYLSQSICLRVSVTAHAAKLLLLYDCHCTWLVADQQRNG